MLFYSHKTYRSVRGLRNRMGMRSILTITFSSGGTNMWCKKLRFFVVWQIIMPASCSFATAAACRSMAPCSWLGNLSIAIRKFRWHKLFPFCMMRNFFTSQKLVKSPHCTVWFYTIIDFNVWEKILKNTVIIKKNCTFASPKGGVFAIHYPSNIFLLGCFSVWCINKMRKTHARVSLVFLVVSQGIFCYNGKELPLKSRYKV